MFQIKTSITILFLAFLLCAQSTYSQSYWEPQTTLTGYVSTEFNYFDNLEGFDYDYAVNVSEAGILVNYQPLSNLTLNTVFVYRPGYDFDMMLNEASGEYALKPYLNVKVGRFLQSLSPMNTYYYAPVNTSATLPIIVSNNEFFPLNIDGVSLNGSIGNNFRVKYDVFAGGYTNNIFKQTGALGFFGNEVNYFNSLLGADPMEIDNFTNMALGGILGFAYKNLAEVGFGFFNPRNEKFSTGFDAPEDFLYPGSPAEYFEFDMELEKFTYGMNFKLQYNNTRLNGEIWTADLSFKDFDEEFDYNGYYVELSHNINRVTPYVRYEDQTAGETEYNRITGGVNFKPSFETTIKLEYLLYQHNDSDTDLHGVVAAFIYSF